jgi:MFS family permease
MAGVWLVASIANLLSASVARRLGLIKAMVLTHLPSAIVLAIIPWAPTWWTSLILLLASSALGSMDQAPRSAFVAAVFSSSERTAVMGTLNLIRTVASTGGPLVTGYLHDKKMWWTTFLVAAFLKVCYDAGLLAMFLRTKLPEYDNGPREVTVTDVDVGILLSENVDRTEYGIVEVEDMDDDDVQRSPRDKATYETIEEAA